MRLISVNTRRLVQVTQEKDKQYAILSHTWDEHEPTYQDFCADPEAVLRTPKVQGLLQMALYEMRPIEYVWIDTICIDKTSSAELQEAINSMYKWYQNASVCYAYLKDVDTDVHSDDKSNTPAAIDKALASSDLDQAIVNSRWFTRGWTLQELIAPNIIYFLDGKWRRIGEKIMTDATDGGKYPPRWKTKTLVPQIRQATNIPEDVLYGKASLDKYSVAQRMSWAARRQTTRKEDQAYCLMGLFGVNMPMLYGEGAAAFVRLQEEIMKRTDDHSLFAYHYHSPPVLKAPSTDQDQGQDQGLPPVSPADYAGCIAIERASAEAEPSSLSVSIDTAPDTMEHHVMTNKGLFIELDTLEVPMMPGAFVARLNCDVDNEIHTVVLPLFRLRSLRRSKLVLRTPGMSPIIMPRWLFDNIGTVTRQQMYITSDPYAANVRLSSNPLLEFKSVGQDFVISEVYPPPLIVEQVSGVTDDKGKRWPVVKLHYATVDPPRCMYIRLWSERHDLSVVAKLKVTYSAWHEPLQAECSVADMPHRMSLLELLLIDGYPEPYSTPQTIEPCNDLINLAEYRQKLPQRKHAPDAEVEVALLQGRRIRVTVVTEGNADDKTEV
ncbi:hypothetical protein SEUCBS140593_006814 [Sporothrix eucalyptigena]|uniref:Heterokaryon incompatibility domain-containing protein n=1 Tax=Sporothrix eucalyptigena TaxID=1812306 RepID=A0ABP0C942_9PEZI